MAYGRLEYEYDALVSRTEPKRCYDTVCARSEASSGRASKREQKAKSAMPCRNRQCHLVAASRACLSGVRKLLKTIGDHSASPFLAERCANTEAWCRPGVVRRPTSNVRLRRLRRLRIRALVFTRALRSTRTKPTRTSLTNIFTFPSSRHGHSSRLPCCK